MSTKVMQTEMMKTRVEKKPDHMISMNIYSEGLDCFDDSPKIRLTVDASGTVVAHQFKSIFLRCDEVTITEEIGIEGVKYMRITQNKQEA